MRVLQCAQAPQVSHPPFSANQNSYYEQWHTQEFQTSQYQLKQKLCLEELNLPSFLQLHSHHQTHHRLIHFPLTHPHHYTRALEKRLSWDHSRAKNLSYHMPAKNHQYLPHQYRAGQKVLLQATPLQPYARIHGENLPGFLSYAL
ncbi:Uncharacterised protein [Chlamydia trachomatis]|nr:Uncharacterised protein [Chlamydia trachomatis]